MEIYDVRPRELLSEKTKSCKVCSGGSLRERDKNKTWRGYKEIPGRVLGELRGGSRWRGRTGRECLVEITLEGIWDVYVQQNKKCVFTGLPVSFFRTEKSMRSGDPEARLARTASVDRIDNTKGYVKGNIRIVHQIVNIMKNQFSDETFIELWISNQGTGARESRRSHEGHEIGGRGHHQGLGSTRLARNRRHR